MEYLHVGDGDGVKTSINHGDGGKSAGMGVKKRC
jgi:hypothetical protein